MPVHPDIFSDAALRHVRSGSSKPPGEMNAAELPPMATSWASTERLPVGSWKDWHPVYRRGLSPCLAHCPVGNDVEGFVSRLRDGDAEGAARLLAAENPLPAVCGRVCYHPCESGCNRARLDGAVGIRAIEKYLSEQPFFRAPEVWSVAGKSSGKTVAVIGSGPSGLGAAWALAILGHQVEIFERAKHPGGLLRYGIPAYRLPKDILDFEIRRILDMGVSLSLGVKVGEAEDLAALLESHDAVFVASGAVRSRSLGLQVPENGGSFSALEFLAMIAEGNPPEIGEKVVVVGGGNSAIDAARSAKRLGAAVTIVYRRGRREMPAFAGEIDDALAENVALVELAIPLELVVENGNLNAVRCLRTRLGEPDDSGRRSPIPIPGSEFEIPASTIINALGEQVDVDELSEDPKLLLALKEIDSWGGSGLQKLFAGGDFAGNERTVAHAIGGGKRAAMAIDRFLTDREDSTLDRFRVGGGPASLAGYLRDGDMETLGEKIRIITYEDLNPVYFPEVERRELERDISPTPVDNAQNLEAVFREVEHGFSGEAAQAEAARCFSCGRCTMCGLCQIFCPEGAVRFGEGGDSYTIFDPHCKGCGICVEECPRSAIVMEPVKSRREMGQ